MKHFSFLILSCVLLISCTKYSTFVADKNNSLLPEYSESGRNIAGALFNDTVWRSDVYINGINGTYTQGFWIISSLSGDSTIIIFNGEYTYNSIKFVDTLPSIPVNLFVVINGLKIENQDSLFKLNNTLFNFDNISRYVTLTYSYNTFSFKKYGECFGSIIFNTVQKNTHLTLGDGSPNNPIVNPFIVSGHFNFTINGTNNYEVKDGRFDMLTQWKTNLIITQ